MAGQKASRIFFGRALLKRKEGGHHVVDTEPYTDITAFFAAAKNSSNQGQTCVITIRRKQQVTFVGDEGMDAIEPQTVGYGLTATEPTITREGYCVNWFSNSERTQAFDFAGEITIDTTIYAKWVQSTIYVAPDGTGDGTAANPMGSIGEALTLIDNASVDYTIKVTGKLTGNQGLGDTLNTRAKSITICGLTGNTADSLYGNNSGTVLTINTTVPVTVKNLRITGGNAEKGGGISMASGTNVTLESGALIGGTAGTATASGESACANYAQQGGGGVYCEGTLTLKNGSSVIYNYCGDGGDGNTGGGICCNGGSLTIESGAKVNLNGGGGVTLTNCSAFSMTGGEVCNNYNSYNGGGFYISGTCPEVMTISGGEISGNSVGSSGGSGGIYYTAGKTLAISGNTVISCNHSVYEGGGIRISSGVLDLSGGTISGNYSEIDNRIGGGIAAIVGGRIQISGSVYIPSGATIGGTFKTGAGCNDIKQNYGAIKIAGPITPPAACTDGIIATITPNYVNGYAVLAPAEGVNKTIFADALGKIAVTPQIVGNDTTRWSINAEGKLLSNEFVPVQGAYFDGSYRIDTSNVFIEGRQLIIQDLIVCDHEVTQKEWYNVMGVTQAQMYTQDYGRGDNYPAYYVGWYNALAYCNKLSIREGLEPVYAVDGIVWDTLYYGYIPTTRNAKWDAATCDFNKNGYRMPTEAEWEYLARGGNLTGEQFVYSGSNDSATVAWTIGSGSTHEVKTKQANTLGLYDMSGNVWEWVWDTTLTITENNHFKCGGSWDYPAIYSTPTGRFYTPPLPGPYSGLRVVRTAVSTDSVTVSFDTRGGDALSPMKVWRGYRPELPTPTKGTLNFGGWYTDSECTTPYAIGSAITADITIYAQWLSDFIEVPGTYFDGTEAVANSAVFVKDTQILIRDLYACDHEVTQSEWYDVMNVPQEQLFAADSGRGPNYPVYNISWYDAIAYCNKLSLKNNLEPVYSVNGVTNWLGLDYADIPTTNNADWNAAVADYDKNGYRLPTEAEWEYLARGGSNWDSYRYSGSNSIDSVAWHNYNSAVNGKSLMHEVKTKRANSLGLYDMSGSTWEWCSDKRKDTVNVRGGSLKCNPLQYSQNDWCAVHRRGGSFPYTKTWELGFRVVRTAKPLYAVVGNVLCPDKDSTINAINNATDSIGVIIFGSVRVSELGAASNSNTIIWAIKNTTAPKVSLVVPEGANIVLTSYYCKWMFSGCEKLVSADLRGFNTENVTDMSNMFFLCKALTTLDLSSFKTANVTKMSSMFGKCSSLTTLDLSSFNTENVTDMSSMFFSCEALTTLDVSGFKTANVTTMDSMFAGCEALTTLDLSSFNTAKVKNMVQMFFYCSALTTLDLSSFNTDSVTTMNDMFESCKALTSLDLSGFSTANVTTMDYMFKECDLLTTIYAADGADWNKDGLSSHYMFNDCPKLVGGNGTNYKFSNANDATYAHIDGGQDNPGYFTEVYARVNGKPCANKDSVIAAIGRATDTVDIVLTSHVTASDLGKANTDGTIIKAISANGNNSARFRLVVPEGANIMLSGDDCKEMFLGCGKLISADLRGFNTSNVTDMSNMFYLCSTIETIDVSGFITDNVTDMRNMFFECFALTTLDVSNFNTVNVTNMSEMFYNCSSLTTIYAANGADWSGVGSSENMFRCSNLVGGNGTTYSSSAQDATRACIDKDGQPGYFTLKYATVGGVICKDKESAIAAISNATGTVDVVLSSAVTVADLGKAGTSGTIINAIKNTTAQKVSLVVPAGANIVLSGDACASMFYECRKLVSADLRGFNTENVTNMSQMFRECTILDSLNLSSFSTSNVTNMSHMFHNDSLLTTLDLSRFNTSADTTMYSMFHNCRSLTVLDVSNFNTSNVNDMQFMFFGCFKLATIYAASGTNWDRDGLKSGRMFEGCKVLKGGKGTAFDGNYPRASRARIDGGSGNEGYFTEPYAIVGGRICTDAAATIAAIGSAKDSISVILSGSVTAAELGKAGTSGTIINAIKNSPQPVRLVVPEGANIVLTGEDCKEMFYYCNKLVSADLRGFNTDSVTNMNSMFYYCKALTTLDVSGFNTANVTGMWYMFGSCTVLTTLDVSGFSTGNVTNMGKMFYDCLALTALDVSGFNTDNATHLDNMFSGCSKLTTLNVSGFNTAKVADMNGMFYRCSALTALDVSGFRTVNVYDMSSMFNECSALTTLDVSGFITSNVTDMSCMFSNCSSVTALDVSGFNTSNVANMSGMFSNCSKLTTLDLSSFNTENVTDMSWMFSRCTSLTTIYAASGTDYWNSASLEESESMFDGCSALKGGNGTQCDGESSIDAMYAHIDGLNGMSGYFTVKP